MKDALLAELLQDQQFILLPVLRGGKNKIFQHQNHCAAPCTLHACGTAQHCEESLHMLLYAAQREPTLRCIPLFLFCIKCITSFEARPGLWRVQIASENLRTRKQNSPAARCTSSSASLRILRLPFREIPRTLVQLPKKNNPRHASTSEQELAQEL